jgi:hypothetical protein
LNELQQRHNESADPTGHPDAPGGSPRPLFSASVEVWVGSDASGNMGHACAKFNMTGHRTIETLIGYYRDGDSRDDKAIDLLGD